MNVYIFNEMSEMWMIWTMNGYYSSRIVIHAPVHRWNLFWRSTFKSMTLDQRKDIHSSESPCQGQVETLCSRFIQKVDTSLFSYSSFSLSHAWVPALKHAQYIWWQLFVYMLSICIHCGCFLKIGKTFGFTENVRMQHKINIFCQLTLIHNFVVELTIHRLFNTHRNTHTLAHVHIDKRTHTHKSISFMISRSCSVKRSCLWTAQCVWVYFGCLHSINGIFQWRLIFANTLLKKCLPTVIMQKKQQPWPKTI